MLMKSRWVSPSWDCCVIEVRATAMTVARGSFQPTGGRKLSFTFSSM